MCQVFTQSLVSKDQFLDCLVFLVHVYVLHLVTMNHPLQLFHLLTKCRLVALLWGLLSKTFVLLFKIVVVNFLFLNYSFEWLNNDFELLSSLWSLWSKFDCIAWMFSKSIASELVGLILNLCDFFFKLVSHNSWNLTWLEFVLLKISDTLLKPCILQIKSLFLELQIKQAFFSLEQLVAKLLHLLFHLLVLTSELVDLFLSLLLSFLASYQLVHRSAD